jgi:hypothetical protein
VGFPARPEAELRAAGGYVLFSRSWRLVVNLRLDTEGRRRVQDLFADLISA